MKKQLRNTLLGLVLLASVPFQTAKAEQGYFDKDTLNQFIADSAMLSQGELVEKMSSFFQSTAFSFDQDTINGILKNGDLYVRTVQDMRVHFSFNHPLLSQIVNPFYEVKTPVNEKFLKALMLIQGRDLKVIADSAKNVFNVSKFPNRDSAYDFSIMYYSCLQSIAVGANDSQCMAQFDPFMTTDRVLRTRYELAYIEAFRIGRLAFISLSKDSILFRNSYTAINITDDEKHLKYNPGYISTEQFNQLSVFRGRQFRSSAECELVYSSLKKMQSIFDSQATCRGNKNSLLGAVLCMDQDFDENKRRVMMPPRTWLAFPQVPMVGRYADTSEEDAFGGTKYLEIVLRNPCEFDPLSDEEMRSKHR
jgi:hypothetical protein